MLFVCMCGVCEQPPSWCYIRAILHACSEGPRGLYLEADIFATLQAHL